MALLQINQDWRIVSDDQCWMVQRYRGIRKTGPRAGEINWESVSYHANLGKAAASLAQRQLRLSEAEGLQAIMDEWERITQEIDEALSNGLRPESSGSPGPQHAP